MFLRRACSGLVQSGVVPDFLLEGVMSGSMSDDLERQVIKLLSGYLRVDRRTINSDSRLVEDLCVDSVGVVEVVMSINEAFDIDLPDADVTEWRTVGDICCLVRKCIISK